MADIQQAIRTLKIQATQEGVDGVTGKLKELSKAQADVAVTSDTTSKASLSLENAFDRLERRYVTTVKAQQDYAKVQQQVNAAVAQHPALMDRGNTVLAEAAARYGQAGVAARAYAAATSGVSAQLIAMSAGAGPVGVFLSALGPWGFAAAVGLGAVTAAIDHMVDEANRMGGVSQHLRDTADTANISTANLQKLENAGADVGLGNDKVASSFDRFNVQLADLQKGIGPFYDSLTRINPALVLQLATTKDAATGWNILAQAYAQADRQQQVLLARAAFGRGGAATGRLLTATASAGGIENLTTPDEALTDQQIQRWADLKTQIDQTNNAAKNLMASIWTPEVLEREKQGADAFLRVAQYAKQVADSQAGLSAWDKFFDNIARYGVAGLSYEEAAKNVPSKSPSPASPYAPSPEDYGNPFDAGAAGGGQLGADFIANQARASVAALGAAATASEKYNAKILELDASLKSHSVTQETYNRAVAGLKSDEYVRSVQAMVSALGSGATVSEQFEARVAGLGRQLAIGAISQDTFNRSVSALRSDEYVRSVQAMVSALGSAATVSELYDANVVALGKQLATGAITQGTYNRAVDGLKQDRVIQSQRDSISALGDSATEAEKYALRLAELHQQLDRGRISQETFNRAVAQADPLMQKARGYANDFGQSLNSSLAQGKSANESIGAGINAVGTKMSSDLMTSGIANGDPVSIGASIAISWLQGEAAKAKQAKADFDAAVTAWAGMQTEVRQFTDTLTGTNTGSLGQSIASMTEKAQQYADAAHKAGQSADALNTALITFAQNATRDFMVGFDVMIEALDQGLGSDSPAVKAQQNVRQIGDTLKGFIDDTQHAGQGLASAAPAISAARDASQSYALSLLQTAPALTDTETSILNLRGSAQQLVTTLQDLGLSADAAGAAVAAGVTQALDKIKSDFTSGIQADINSASGQGYINDIQNLLTGSAQKFQDAQSLGADPALIGRYFAVQAQQIVDNANLVGDSFNSLITMFPELSGVVTDATSALSRNVDAQKQFRDQLKATIDDFILGNKLGSQSTLSPQDQFKAAQDAFQQQLGRAQGGNQDALTNITKSAQDYLDQARSYLGPSSQFGAISDSINTALQALPDQAMLDPVVAAINESTATLKSIEALQSLTKGISDSIDLSTKQLGAQSSDLATFQGSTYFGPMTSYLAAIAANTALSGQAASDPGSGFEWYNPFTWFHDGGIVGRYAGGGVVGNGTYNVDSVLARYAGGGQIMLGGGEAITRATSVNANTLPMLNAINYTGRVPDGAGSNDNGQVVAALTRMERTLTSALGQIAQLEMQLNAGVTGVQRSVDGLRTDTRQAKEEKRLRA